MRNDVKKTVEGFVLSELKPQPLKQLYDLSRKVAAEGIVMLKNDNNTLPIKQGQTVSVFGRIQTDYIKSGTGSGGMVNVEYVTNILDGLRNNKNINVNEKLAKVYSDWIEENPFDKGKGWAQEPWSQKEMPLDVAVVEQAANSSDVAIVIIGRSAGEDKDNSSTPGSYQLTDIERDMLKKVTDIFDRVCVVLNTGNIIDTNFVNDYKFDSLLYVWQGGMEGGNAAADVICGESNPCGKLSDTIAYQVSDYPSDSNFGDKIENKYVEDIYVGYRYFETVAADKVQYPFGFGLSFTTFDVTTNDISVRDNNIIISVTVKNTGKYSGKEVVQVYYQAPQGKLGKPLKQLAAFAKTKQLNSNESQTLEISFNINKMASFDDSGYTGNKDCYVLESGEYIIYVGTQVRNATEQFKYNLAQTVVTERLTEALAPVKDFKRMHPVLQPDGSLKMEYRQVPKRTIDLNKRIEENLPETIKYTGDKGIKLVDVYNGKFTMEQFIAQLSDFDLACIVRGEGMSSPKVTPGTGSAFGGVTDRLLDLGIPVACTTDGPSGIRMDSGAKATSLPNGTLLACTWDDQLVEQLYTLVGIELYAYEIDALLGPGMNIHRHPLNGRNFEYFSEDPLLTGKMASAIAKGIKKSGPTATIKHFIANNQEISRSFGDSVISQRAIREIYLKGFEIAVKEGNATAIMTTYNPVNGFWNASNYDLNTTVLRGEWNYKGFVMTDWWAKANDEGEEGTQTNLKSMIRSQNDVYMVCKDSQSYKDNLIEALESGDLTRGELQRCAINICRYIIDVPVFERYVEGGCKKPVFATVDDSKMQDLFTFDKVKAKESYEFSINEPGNYIFDFILSSPADALSQMAILIKLNDTDTATLSINGTNGETTIQKREIELKQGNNKMTFEFGDTVNVEKVIIKI